MARPGRSFVQASLSSCVAVVAASRRPGRSRRRSWRRRGERCRRRRCRCRGRRRTATPTCTTPSPQVDGLARAGAPRRRRPTSPSSQASPRPTTPSPLSGPGAVELAGFVVAVVRAVVALLAPRAARGRRRTPRACSSGCRRRRRCCPRRRRSCSPRLACTWPSPQADGACVGAAVVLVAVRAVVARLAGIDDAVAALLERAVSAAAAVAAGVVAVVAGLAGAEVAVAADVEGAIGEAGVNRGRWPAPSSHCSPPPP